jgi:hypothetical protein
MSQSLMQEMVCAHDPKKRTRVIGASL